MAPKRQIETTVSHIAIVMVVKFDALLIGLHSWNWLMDRPTVRRSAYYDLCQCFGNLLLEKPFLKQLIYLQLQFGKRK